MDLMAYGDGTITLRADGRLQVAVMIDGRRRFRYVAARTVKASPKAAMERARDLRRGLLRARDAQLDPSAQTLADFLRSWISGLRDAKRQRVRPRTLDHYAMIVERHIIPALGHHKLERLSERHVQAWLDADDAKPRTVAHHRAVLRRALNVAVRQRIVERNVAVGVELAKVPEYTGKPLTIEEAKALLAVESPLAVLWRLAIDTGLRQAELLGLGWDDVDLEAGTVTVTGQLQRRGGSWVRSATKAARSLPRLSLAPATVAALDAHRKTQAAARRPDWPYWGLLFLTPDGQPLQGAVVLRAFHAACKAAGIELRRFHDLRGSAATLMAELGVAEDVRMRRLGHSTKAMSRHYAQASGAQDRLAADLLGEALGR